MKNNILILNMTRMGDLIQSTPVISGLRKQHPNACITLLVTSLFGEFSKRIPYIDERIIFDITQFENKRNPNGTVWIKLYKYIENLLNELKSKKFDLVVNLSHSKLSAFMISYLGISNLRGFGCNGTGDRLTRDPWMQYFGTEPFNRDLNPFNLVEIFTRSVGALPEDNPISIGPIDDTRDAIDEVISEYNIKNEDFVIGIQAGSSIKGRRWSPKSFAELSDGIVEHHDAKILLFGVESENELSQEIKSYIKHKNKIIDLTGKTNIGQLIKLVKKCAYLVTNDTGTMHIAAAVGTPIVGLFFAHAHPFETGPYSPGHLIFQARISCAPCSYGAECNDIVCVRKVLPEHLLSMIKVHQDEGEWLLPKTMSGLKEINIYTTYIGDDHRLCLRPLIKHPLALNDIFREVYATHWLHSLGSINIYGNWNSSNIEKNLKKNYDCKNAYKIITNIKEKINNIRAQRNNAIKGVHFVDEIIKICSDNKSSQITRLKYLADKIELIDNDISKTGLVHPEFKPVTDMFSKRKENLQGEDPKMLAKEMKIYYQKFSDETDLLMNLLSSVVKSLDISGGEINQAAVSSINVEVPGR